MITQTSRAGTLAVPATKHGCKDTNYLKTNKKNPKKNHFFVQTPCATTIEVTASLGSYRDLQPLGSYRYTR